MTATELIPPLARRRSDLLVPALLLGTASLAWRTALLALEPGGAAGQPALIRVFPAVCVDLLVAYAVLFGVREARSRIAASNWPRHLSRLAAASAMVLTISLALYVGGVRLLDYACFYYSGRHLDETFFRHAEGAAMQILPASEWALVIALVLAPLALGVVATLTLMRRLGGVPRRHPRRSLTLIALATCGALFALTGATDRPGQPSGPANSAWSFPELAIWEAFSDDRSAPAGETLHPGIEAKLARLGREIEAQRQLPLVRPNAFDAPFPHATKPGATATPNIVVLFFESFSSALCSTYASCEHPGLTPNLEAMGRESHVVEGFRNASTPTLPGIKATLSSYLSPSDPMTWADDSHKNIQGLPEILTELGYHSTFVHQVDKSYIRTDEVMRSLGFAEVSGEKEVGRALREEPRSWGYSDHQMFRYLEHQMERDAFEEPFLVTMPTLDSHAPFRLPEDSVTYGDGSDDLLNTVHGTDHAFGEFWRYFQQSRYADNTIVIVVADHAMLPGNDYRRIRTDDVYGRFFDEIALLIYNPTRDMVGRSHVVSSQVDLAPTILHMLDHDVPNHFEGQSLFGGRREHPGAIGMNHELFFVAQPHDGEIVEDWFELRDVATRPASHDAGTELLTRQELYRYFQWKSGIHAEDRVWR